MFNYQIDLASNNIICFLIIFIHSWALLPIFLLSTLHSILLAASICVFISIELNILWDKHYLAVHLLFGSNSNIFEIKSLINDFGSLFVDVCFYVFNKFTYLRVSFSFMKSKYSEGYSLFSKILNSWSSEPI